MVQHGRQGLTSWSFERRGAAGPCSASPRSGACGSAVESPPPWPPPPRSCAATVGRTGAKGPSLSCVSGKVCPTSRNWRPGQMAQRRFRVAARCCGPTPGVCCNRRSDRREPPQAQAENRPTWSAPSSARAAAPPSKEKAGESPRRGAMNAREGPPSPKPEETSFSCSFGPSRHGPRARVTRGRPRRGLSMSAPRDEGTPEEGLGRRFHRSARRRQSW